MASIQALLLLWPLVFLTPVASDQDNLCGRPVLADSIEAEGLQKFSPPGSELVLSCRPGHYPTSGQRTIVCGASGTWSRTRFTCTAVSCPGLDELSNGDIHYEDNTYLSTVNYTCRDGYTVHGASSAVCQQNGMWSAPRPQCKPVTCDLAPIPAFGKLEYDRKVSGNTTVFGTSATYECLPPLALIGNARGQCTSTGEWTAPPKCQLVTCPPPAAILNGFMSALLDKTYDYRDRVQYGCHGDHVIEGSMEAECQETGAWSDTPVCRAPCSVGVVRGRVLYKGTRLWIADLQPNRVFHGEVVSVYCLNAHRKCGYAVPAQCNDGKLHIPECYEEPSAINYSLHSGSLPSEIKQC